MNLVSLASTVAALFNGTVTVGGLSLSGLEVPEKLAWGGEQRMTVHKLPGGARVFDLLGQDDSDISWSGYFQGTFANYRARAFDALRIAGTPVPLSWPGFTRTVIITKFTCSSERNGFLLPYSITCSIVPTPQVPGGPNLLGQITNDIGSAIGVPNLVATVTPYLQSAQTALQQVQRVMPIVGVLTSGSPAFVAVTSALGTAQGVIGVGMAAATAAMLPTVNAAAATRTLLGTTSPAAAVSTLGNALTQAASMAGLSQMANFAGRSVANLTNAGA